MKITSTVSNVIRANKLAKENADQKAILEENRIDELAVAKAHLEELKRETELYMERNTDLTLELNRNRILNDKLKCQIETNTEKLRRLQRLVKQINSSVDHYYETEKPYKVSIEFLKSSDYDDIRPKTRLPLHCLDEETLRDRFLENDKEIDELITRYTKWYTDKSKRTIYGLMVVAMRAELQNILYKLKYENLEEGVAAVKEMTDRYYEICSDGNQKVKSTMKQFIGEINYLFTKAVKIEHAYYQKRAEQKKEEEGQKEKEE